MIVGAKLMIALLLLALLACQLWVIPTMAGEMAVIAPEFAHLRIPGLVMTTTLVACVELVLVSVWRLLSLISGDRIFDRAAFTWVNLIIGAVVAAVLLVALGMMVIDRAGAGGPMIAITGTLTVLTGAGLALVVGVLRGLLLQAAQLHDDLAEVV